MDTNTDKRTLTITARTTVAAQASIGVVRHPLAEGWVGRWSGYEITFDDGTVLTVSSGIRGTAEIVAATENGDAITIWIR